MHLTLSLLAALVISFTSFAQFNYTFSVKQETYQPLTGGTSINNSMLWDEEIYKIPIGFSFVLDGDTIDSCYATGPTAIFNDTTGKTLSSFWTILADLYDRGTNNGGISQSPLSYKTTGAAGSRVCKIEIANAGFWDEYDKYSTYSDFTNLQVWLYEGSNTVELHYGASQVTHPVDYFMLHSSPLAGLFRMTQEGDTVRALYYLHGNPAGPLVDSVKNEDFNLLLLPKGLNAMPASGTVYRFEPLPTSINTAMKRLDGVDVYPTVCTSKIWLSNDNSEPMYYTVYTTAGRKTALHGSITRGIQNQDVSGLAPGMYIMYLESGNKQSTLKLLKQ